jgi:gas vesicle protein
MEVTAWKRNDELVSMLTTLGDHIQNGRGEGAIAAVQTIQKDGRQFQEAVKTATDCLNEMFQQKKKEMEAMQEKRDEIKDKIPSLQTGIDICEEKITKHQNEVESSGRRRTEADYRYEQADRDWADGQEQTGLRWWHIAVPVVGPIVGISNHVSGKNKMARANERMADAKRDHEIAQLSIYEAEHLIKSEEEKLGHTRDLVDECESLVSELHKEAGVLKDATAFTLELSGVLEQVLGVAKGALGRTGRLKTMLDHFFEKPSVLNSLGTRTLLRSVGERWAEVKTLAMTVPVERNALIWREAHRYVKV